MLFLAAVVLGGLFVWHERRDTRSRCWTCSLFRSVQVLDGASCGGVGSYLVMFGVLLLVPFYLERGLGFGTARSGLELMAMPLAFGIVAPLAGRAPTMSVPGSSPWSAWPRDGRPGPLGALAPDTAAFLILLAAIGRRHGTCSPRRTTRRSWAQHPGSRPAWPRGVQHDPRHRHRTRPGGHRLASSSWRGAMVGPAGHNTPSWSRPTCWPAIAGAAGRDLGAACNGALVDTARCRRSSRPTGGASPTPSSAGLTRVSQRVIGPAPALSLVVDPLVRVLQAVLEA